MKFLVSMLIFGIILFLLVISFQKYPGESVSELDEAGRTFVGDGIQSDMQNQNQMQSENAVAAAQQEGVTTLDTAIEAAKEEIKKWEDGSIRMMQEIWDKTKESAIQMALDTVELIYPLNQASKSAQSAEFKNSQAGR